MASTSVFVPASRVIATAMSVLEGADSMDKAYFKEWLYLGMLDIGITNDWFDQCTLYPDNYTLKKPDGFQSAIDLALYDANNNEFEYVLRGMGTRIHASDNGLINNNEYFPSLGAPIDLSEDPYYFHIGSNGASISYATLKFWKYPIDENGDILVPEQDLLPLVFFIRYMWYLRKDDKQGIAMANQKWIASRNEARAAHKTPSILEGTEIARSWVTLIPKMRFKKF